MSNDATGQQKPNTKIAKARDKAKDKIKNGIKNCQTIELSFIGLSLNPDAAKQRASQKPWTMIPKMLKILTAART